MNRIYSFNTLINGFVQKIVIDLAEISSIHYTPAGKTPPEGVSLFATFIMKNGYTMMMASDGHLENVEKAWREYLGESTVH